MAMAEVKMPKFHLDSYKIALFSQVACLAYYSYQNSFQYQFLFQGRLLGFYGFAPKVSSILEVVFFPFSVQKLKTLLEFY